MKIELKRINKAVLFEAVNEDGCSIRIDGAPSIGGENKGVRPMQLLLMGLGGCSAMDIVSILTKQKQVIEDFGISIEGEKEEGKDVSLWKSAHMVFRFTGNLDKDKVQRAVDLSVQKYCSVAKTLEAAGAKITYSVSLTPPSTGSGQAPSPKEKGEM